MVKTKIIFSDKRINWMIFLMSFLVLLIIIKIIKIQIIDHEKYKALAREEHVKFLTIPAERGKIYLSDGDQISPLVLNNKVFDVYIDPSSIKDKNNNKIIKMIKKHCGNKIMSNYRKLFKMNNTQYQVVAKNLTQKEAKKIKEENYLGVGLVHRNKRFYPEGKLASQIIGFVNSENQGQYGVEQKLNKRLKGKNGYLKTVTDISEIPLTIGNNIVSIKPKNGDNLILTIDRNIQFKAEETLKKYLDKFEAKEGSVLVIDPRNGQILAMANYPDYYPENFNKIKDVKVFNNFITTNPYEAGSVIKSFTCTMGIDTKKIIPETLYQNKDCVNVADRRICNVIRNMNYQITIQDALNYSLNTGMIEVLKRIGNGKITKKSRAIMYDYFNNKYRFGKPTGVEVPEYISRIISPDEVQGNAVRYSNMTFGQGFAVTMLQAAAGYSSIINGGYYYKPTVIKGVYNEKDDVKIMSKPIIIAKNTISKKTSISSKQMFQRSRQKFIKSDLNGFMVGGKTGTSETIINGTYNMSETVGSYLGYGGTQKEPKYVIMVRMAKGKEGMAGYKHAAPVFNELSNWLINYLKLQPKE